MTSKYILLPIITIAALYLSACQKDFTVDNTIVARVDSTVTPSFGDSNYLSKIFFNDTSYFGGNIDIDTSIFVFNYDGNKRLKSVVLKEGPNSTAIGDVYLECFYNQNDSLPYKAIFPLEQSTYHFYYDNTGKLIKDSINNLSGNNVHLSRNLTYSGNKIFAQVSSNYLGITSNIEKDTFLFDTRGNMISSKYYIRTNSINFELASSTSSTFDNGLSPFLKTPSFRIFSFTFGTIHFEAHYNNFGLNNILVDMYNRYPFTGGTSSSSSDTTSVVNTYYQNGLLKNVKGYRSTWTYIYKSL